MPFQPREIGDRYDIGIETRDGSPITVVGQGGVSYSISQVGLVLSRQQDAFREGTELERRRQLTYSSPNMVDRDMEVWPTVSQGDWSGGTKQKVYTSDPTRYSTGRGLPLNPSDPVIQRPIVTQLYLASANAPNNNYAWADFSSYNLILLPPGVVVGGIGYSLTPPFTYAESTSEKLVYFYSYGSAGNYGSAGGLIGIRGTGVPFGAVPSSVAADVAVYGGHQYEIGFSGVPTNPPGSPPVVSLYLNGDWTGTAATDLMFPISYPNGPSSALITVGSVGTNVYYVIAYSNAGIPGTGGSYATTGPVRNTVLIYAVSTGGPFRVSSILAPSNFNSVPLPPSAFGPAGSLSFGRFVTSMLIYGGELYCAWSDSHQVEIHAFNFLTSTWRYITTIVPASVAFMAAGGSGIFIISGHPVLPPVGAASVTTAAASPDISNNNWLVSTYLLQGNSLQFIETITPESALLGGSYTYANCFSKPVVVDPFAFFTVDVSPNPGTSTFKTILYAFDMARGRLFRCEEFDTQDPKPGHRPGYSIAASNGMSLPITPPPGECRSPLVIAVQSLRANGNVVITGFLFNPATVSPSAVNGIPYNPGMEVYSSAIDFSGPNTNKLFQTVEATFAPIQNNATVTLSAYVNRDPYLSLVGVPPDFGPVSTNVNGATSLVLPINQMAKNLIYYIRTDPPASGLPTAVGQVGAPRVLQVSVRAASGRIWELKLMWGMSVKSLDGRDDIFSHQGFDEVAARNFLWSLYRQNGGRCLLDLPTGEQFPGLIQRMEVIAARPQVVSADAQHQSSRINYELHATIREDT